MTKKFVYLDERECKRMQNLSEHEKLTFLETITCNTIFKMNIAIALLHFSPQTSVQFSFKLETMPLDFRRSKSNTCIQNRQDDIKILFTLA